MGLTAIYRLTCDSYEGCDAERSYDRQSDLLTAARLSGWVMDASLALALCPEHAPKPEATVRAEHQPARRRPR